MKSGIFLPFVKCLLTCILLTGILPGISRASQKWNIVINEKLMRDEAIRVAIEDVINAGNLYDVEFEIKSDNKNSSGQTILVGNPQRNQQVSKLVGKKIISLAGVDDEQGYEIITKVINGNKTVFVCGGSVIGDVYGLYWIWDRIRVYKEIPEINVKKEPVLKMRVNLAWGRWGGSGETKEQMRNALRYGMNWVSGKPVLDLVPWKSEPESTINKENRDKTRELIKYAHSLHMKYFSFANEFTYHPSILDEFGATLSPSDPCFWDALQAKYRRLFQALPELDGIELCNDDISGFWDDYRGFDLMHEGEGCDWPLDKRFRTFVKKISNVVVNEFNKVYFHFTWSLTSYEQHYQADVYKKIFTDDVPVKNLYLAPKITSGDRWWHQPYNPTFNITPHNTIVCFETMNYYESSKAHIFPTFPGQYYQAGVETFLAPQDNNLKGAGFLANSSPDEWNTRSVTAYVISRLAWNPKEDMRAIARDFCAIHFGVDAADEMAEIYLLSPAAYKYGLHIEPVSYGQFNSFIHMRVGTFPAMGYPVIDNGKEHLEFLHKIYLRCRPWKEETLQDLDHGVLRAETMVDKFSSVESKIHNTVLAEKLKNSIEMTRLLIKTNNLYVKTAFAYFQYSEDPTEENKNNLADTFAQLKQTRLDFMNAPGYGYQLFGVNQLLDNAEQALDDLNNAKDRLRQAPDRKKIEETIASQQEIYARILTEHSKDATKLLHMETEIDGRDILHIKGDNYNIEHLRWDPPTIKSAQFFAALPDKEVTVIPKDIDSRPMHPFILEQPCKENNYTARIYLYDAPGGKGVCYFDLYYIEKSPKELGLVIPWGK